jgi:hypothetical protein
MVNAIYNYILNEFLIIIILKIVDELLFNND